MAPAPADDGIACTPGATNNWCAPNGATDRGVQKAVRDLEASGWECSPEPELVDRVLFQFREDNRVETLTFDEAYAAGGDGLGWSQQFCFAGNR